MPPWINKFYILDLNPEKLHPLGGVGRPDRLLISWVNPDKRHANKDFGRLYARGHPRCA